MVCPVCITTALLANAPAIAASIGGAAAVKMAIQKSRAPGVVCQRQQPGMVSPKQPRTIIDPAKLVRYDEQDW